MNKQPLCIEGIPAVLYGENSDKVYVYVHGKESCKEAAADFAAIAGEKSFSVLSFDFAGHGERKGKGYLNVSGGADDLNKVADYAVKRFSCVSLYAVSIGAYISLQTLFNRNLKNCLFVSPVLDMAKLIEKMMVWFNISSERLKAEGKIATPMGETLDWEYYTLLRSRTAVRWSAPSSVIIGENDALTDLSTAKLFCEESGASLTVLAGAEHYLHTPEELKALRQWEAEHI